MIYCFHLLLSNSTCGATKREQSSDGFYNLSIPAELLKEVNIVDTPGTNVILERQQRLTEVGPGRCC